MAEPTAVDNRTLLRRTLITASAMVGGCVVIVGTISLIAVAIVGKASSAQAEPEQGGTGSGAVVPASNVHGSMPGPKVPPPAANRR